jgi:hypothetical protein
MILAFHSIFSLYGFWLPNDPRGSESDYVASWDLFRYGPASKTASRRSLAAAAHDRALRAAAKSAHETKNWRRCVAQHGRKTRTRSIEMILSGVA